MILKVVTVVLTLLTMLCFASKSAEVTMKTKAGTFIGKTESVAFDGTTRTMNQFLGIRYARAPFGDLRFKKPLPAEPLSEPYTAHGFGSICPQGGKQVVQLSDVTLSEDCLFLNIFAPPSNGENLLPVMIFIHGGGYTTGASNFYVGDILSTFGDVIIVTLNYRLSIFGFLYSEDDEAPGNMALWDQHLAIKWVYDNIDGCYGDKRRITLFGQGSGAESVIYQSLFPGNKGMFQRVIAESGTPVAFRGAHFGRIDNHVSPRTIGHTVGCIYKTTREIVSCIRTKTTKEIVLDLKSSFYQIPFTPVHDGEFVKDDPQVMLDKTNTQFSDVQSFFASLDFMIGGNNMDGAVYMYFLWKGLLIVPNMEHFTVNQDKFRKSIVPAILSQVYGRRFPDYVSDAVMTRYSDVTNMSSNVRRRDMLLQLTTDYIFTVPILHTARLHSSLVEGKTYVYNFVANSSLSYSNMKPSWIDGASHGDEIPFVFGFSRQMLNTLNVNTSYHPTSDEVDLSKRVMSLWTNFANTGLPNFPKTIPEIPVWPKFTKAVGNYLELSTSMSASGPAKEGYGEPGGSFWLGFLPQILSNRTDPSADVDQLRISCPSDSSTEEPSGSDTVKIIIPILGVVLCIFAIVNIVVCACFQKRQKKPQSYNTVEM